ncbi:flagellar hook-basal body complex protein [Desulfosporosinus fructosivorans]
MMRSLYAAVSGLKNHQVKMDVIGNNVANVNTTGFKRSRVTFSTMLSQTLKGASTPNNTGTPASGGTNPVQIGLGVSLGSIDQIMTQGSSQSTGNPTDMMIEGSGYFVLTTDGTDRVYTRSGAFTLDGEGYLVDPGSGAQVLDTNDEAIHIDFDTYSSYSIDGTGVITGIRIDTGEGEPIDTNTGIAIAKFSNDAGLTSLGGSFYQVSNNSGPAIVYGDGASEGPYLAGTKLIVSAVEMSNVDLSTEFTDMITAQRGFQANSRVITVSDTLLEELINLKR